MGTLDHKIYCNHGLKHNTGKIIGFTNPYTKRCWKPWLKSFMNLSKEEEFVIHKKPTSTKKKKCDRLKKINKQRIKKEGYVYFITEVCHREYCRLHYCTCECFVKIGYSADPNTRIKNIQVNNPREVKLLYVIKSNDVLFDEGVLHSHLNDKRHMGEWFIIEKNLLDKIVKSAILCINEMNTL
jgi:hypothetical protein